MLLTENRLLIAIFLRIGSASSDSPAVRGLTRLLQPLPAGAHCFVPTLFRFSARSSRSSSCSSSSSFVFRVFFARSLCVLGGLPSVPCVPSLFFVHASVLRVVSRRPLCVSRVPSPVISLFLAFLVILVLVCVVSLCSLHSSAFFPCSFCSTSGVHCRPYGHNALLLLWEFMVSECVHIVAFTVRFLFASRSPCFAQSLISLCFVPLYESRYSVHVSFADLSLRLCLHLRCLYTL